MTSSLSNTHEYSSRAEYVSASDWNAHMGKARYTFADSPITLDHTKRYIIVNTTDGPITINLPDTFDNRYVIKNTFDAGLSGNDITLVASANLEDNTIHQGECAKLILEDTEGWLWVS